MAWCDAAGVLMEASSRSWAGMARNAAGLRHALQKIPQLREEFWQNLNVPGDGDSLNQSLERAGRVADFLELAELLCLDALERDESCGCHFREEHVTPDGECERNDEQYAYVAAWEYAGADDSLTRTFGKRASDRVRSTASARRSSREICIDIPM